MQSVGAPLRPGLPAAREAVRRRQRLGQAQQLVDGHRHRARTCSSPGDTPHENIQFLFFCAAVIAGREQAPGAAARVASRAPARTTASGANEAPPAIISIFLGAELEKVFETIERARAIRHTPGLVAGARHAGAAAAAEARRRPQPDHAVRLHRQQVRVPRARLERSRSRCPNTVLNTIVAEAIDELADELEATRRAATWLDDGRRDVVRESLRRQQAGLLQRRQLLRGVARRGRAARAEEPAHHSRRAAGAASEPTRSPRSRSTACSPSASSSRATRSGSSSTRRSVNIEAETAASIARTHAPAGGPPPPRADSRPAGIDALATEMREPGRRVRLRDRGAREGQRPPGRSRASSWRSTCATTRSPRWTRSARWPTGSSARGRRPLAAAEVRGDALHQVGGGRPGGPPRPQAAGRSRRLPRRAQLGPLTHLSSRSWRRCSRRRY